MASSNQARIIAIALAAIVVVAAALAFIRPSLVGLGDDEVAEFVVLPLPSDRSETVTDASVRTTVEIIERRADAFGIDLADVGREDGNLVLQLEEGNDPDDNLEDLIAPADLSIIDYEASLIGAGPLDSLSAAIEATGPSDDPPGHFYLLDRDDELLAGPVFSPDGLSALTDARYPSGVPDGSRTTGVVATRRVLEEHVSLGADTDLTQSSYTPVQYRPTIRAGDIDQAFAQENPAGDDVVVVEVGVDLTPEGAEDFRLFTERLAERGQLLRENQTMAVLLDNQIVSRPFIDYRTLPRGIEGGRIVIQVERLSISADRLAAQLNLGPLPLHLEVLERR